MIAAAPVFLHPCTLAQNFALSILQPPRVNGLGTDGESAPEKKKKKKKDRSRQGSNLRGHSPTDVERFKSVSLTTRTLDHQRPFRLACKSLTSSKSDIDSPGAVSVEGRLEKCPRASASCTRFRSCLRLHYPHRHFRLFGDAAGQSECAVDDAPGVLHDLSARSWPVSGHLLRRRCSPHA